MTNVVAIEIRYMIRGCVRFLMKIYNTVCFYENFLKSNLNPPIRI